MGIIRQHRRLNIVSLLSDPHHDTKLSQAVTATRTEFTMKRDIIDYIIAVVGVVWFTLLLTYAAHQLPAEKLSLLRDPTILNQLTIKKELQSSALRRHYPAYAAWLVIHPRYSECWHLSGLPWVQLCCLQFNLRWGYSHYYYASENSSRFLGTHNNWWRCRGTQPFSPYSFWWA